MTAQLGAAAVPVSESRSPCRQGIQPLASWTGRDSALPQRTTQHPGGLADDRRHAGTASCPGDFYAALWIGALAFLDDLEELAHRQACGHRRSRADVLRFRPFEG